MRRLRPLFRHLTLANPRIISKTLRNHRTMKTADGALPRQIAVKSNQTLTANEHQSNHRFFSYHDLHIHQFFRKFLISISAIIVLLGLGMYLNGQGYFAGSNWLFDTGTDIYGRAASRLTNVHLLWSYPLRSGSLDNRDIQSISNGSWAIIGYKEQATSPNAPGLRIMPETPDITDFDNVIKICSDRDVDVLVESSGMDAWHTSRPGWQALNSMRSRTLRVVIFDGGHHLPTLGIQPDMIIVPDTMGYAAHGYMEDAIPIQTLLKIAERENLPFTIVSMSRWGLVKTADSMSRISCRALAKTRVGRADLPIQGHILAPHFTRWGSAAFVYIDNADQLRPIQKAVQENLEIKRLYAAFNYSKLEPIEIDKCLRSLQTLRIKAEIVNEPLNVPAVITQEVY